MNHIDKAQLKGIYILVGAGVVMLGLSFILGEDFDLIAAFLGAGFIFGATILAGVMGAIHLPVFGVRLIARFATTVWEDEILYTESGEFQIRYGYDELELPWFVASDVCIAIGINPPNKIELKWGKMAGLPLTTHKKLATFSEKGVQAFLETHAAKNMAANKLLNRIRSQVLRKLEKQRHDNMRYSAANDDQA